MQLFFSRRTYNAQTAKFTNNPAALTRYVMMTGQAGLPGRGNILTRESWIQQVIQQAAPAREILFYVHGFNTEQAEMLARHALIEAGLRANGYRGAVVSFDWPSNGSVHHYDSDRTNAKKVAPYLVTEGIGLFLNEVPRMKLHVLAHSMGALLTLRGFSGVGDAVGARPWDVDQVLFTAADIDAEWMRRGAWGALVMERRCHRLTNYYSNDDQVLQLSGSIINGGRIRAGAVGMPDAIPDNHVDLRATEQYRDKVPGAQKTLMGSHRWYFEDAGYLKDVALTVAGQDAGTMPTRRVANITDRVLLT